ncbi:MAG TPA: hypothetical protein VLJ42_08780 [Solirubrobacteraceae bacterium]|nr:hypothetical protein [Solirubrobacteraceae bacterium]
MSQVSRPFQIALVALVLFVAVWFVALRGHSANPSSTPSASPTAAPTAGSSAQGSKTYTGSAPGVSGLTRAVDKAHGAVSTSEQNAKQLQQKSNQASSDTSASPSAPAASAASPVTPTGAKGSTGSGSSSATKQPAAGAPAAGSSKQSSTTARQAVVEHELAKGKVVALLFWNPKSTDDRAVHTQLHDLSHRGGKIAVHAALQGQVASFGAYTRGVQVLETPTVLVIDKHGHATTLTGLTDARTIQQTIGDALRGGAGKTLAPKFTAWTPKSNRSQLIRRAQKICSQKVIVKPKSATPKALAAAFAQVLQVAQPRIAQIERAAPASDKAFIVSMLELVKRGLARFQGVPTAPNTSVARIRLLQGQAYFDQAYNGLQSYGIQNCVAISG